MTKTFIASAIALLCAPITTPAAAAAAAADFTGPRIETHIGYDNAATKGFSHGGFAYGIGAGYDFAVAPTLILGVEANADLATTDITGSAGPMTAKFAAKRDLSALVRLGTRVGARTLLYAKAGYANGRLDCDIRYAGHPRRNFAGTMTGSGLRGAIGVEYAITPKLYGSLEYQYTNYVNVTRNQALIGVGVRF